MAPSRRGGKGLLMLQIIHSGLGCARTAGSKRSFSLAGKQRFLLQKNRANNRIGAGGLKQLKSQQPLTQLRQLLLLPGVRDPAPANARACPPSPAPAPPKPAASAPARLCPRQFSATAAGVRVSFLGFTVGYECRPVAWGLALAGRGCASLPPLLPCRLLGLRPRCVGCATAQREHSSGGRLLERSCKSRSRRLSPRKNSL